MQSQSKCARYLKSISSASTNVSTKVCLDVGHLEFLNMFEDDGVELNRIERTSHYRVFDPIYVDGGIPIGTRIETAAYVS